MDHFERLMQMYHRAPVHDFYEGIQISVSGKKAEISLPIDRRYYHAGNTIHGSVYFKLLDDACYFACQSVVTDFFLLTSSFHIHLLRPVSSGIITAVGKADFVSMNLCTASAELFNEKGKLVGSGQGQFMKSKLKLGDVEAYLR